MAESSHPESGTLQSSAEAVLGTPEEAPPPGRGTELRGRFRYRLERRLGRGAFGSVFQARCLDYDSRRDDSPPARVAVKILRSARGPGLSMLKRELSAMLALDDERVPQIYDWSLEGSYAFVVMQYYASGSLRDVMPLQGPVEEEVVWRLLADLLTALDTAHRASILHLDIKPANVLLGDDGGYVLTDFGVSQASRIGRGLLPMSVGTPGYQAPEQRLEKFEQYDLRTDLWGVGATAWALATGINLAERDNLARNDDPDSIYGLPPLSDYRIYCSPELENTIMSLLRLDPAQRPGSAAEVLARVAANVSGSPFQAETFVATRRSTLSDEEVEEVVESLVDPLLMALCRQRGFRRFIAKYEDGETLCGEGDRSYYAFLLLRGDVSILKNGRETARVSGEGRFMGEVATLVGMPRTATMVASGTVYACVLNAAELERFVTCNPAMGLRVIRSFALRLSRAPGARNDAAEDDFLSRLRRT
ncbi:MAG: protein kinase [Myxococcota bacterium]|nr:protein kinase [Myxococcota bacterium]